MIDLSRQSMIMHFNPEEWPVLIIGAGGIGSNAAYVLASMGLTDITVYDPEVVGPENIAPQFYKWSQIGQYKVEALDNNIFDFTGAEIKKAREVYKAQKANARIVLVGVDHIAIRKRIWQQHRIEGWEFWLDGRMGGPGCEFYSIWKGNSDHVALYNDKFLGYAHSEQPCGLKATAGLTKGLIQGMLWHSLYKIFNHQLPPLFQTFEGSVSYGDFGG